MFSERKCPTNEKSNEPKKLYLGNFGWKEISTGKTKAVVEQKKARRRGRSFLGNGSANNYSAIRFLYTSYQKENEGQVYFDWQV